VHKALESKNTQPEDGHWKGPKHVAVVVLYLYINSSNKLSCVLTIIIYIVFMLTTHNGDVPPQSFICNSNLKSQFLLSLLFLLAVLAEVTEFPSVISGKCRNVHPASN
jgi:hypothetical protein